MPERDDFQRRRKADEQKELFNEIIREWLDEQFALFGRWTLRGILLIAFSIFIHLLISSKTDDLSNIVRHAAEVAR